MVFFNYALRKLNAKIVYYGPGLCGKTTNLQWIHDHFEGGQRGKMISLSTEGDRTIFFDLLPLEIGTIRGMQVTLQLYTVPGQVHYNSTRQLVLRGADGVVFVGDSQRTMQQSNIDSLKNLKENLMLQGVELESFPHVIQFNKRDLDDLITIEEMDQELNLHSMPFFEAIATEGVGVQETLEGIVKLVMRSLRERYEPVISPEPEAAPAPLLDETPAPQAPPPVRATPPPPVAPVTPPPPTPAQTIAIPDSPGVGPSASEGPKSPFDFPSSPDEIATGVYATGGAANVPDEEANKTTVGGEGGFLADALASASESEKMPLPDEPTGVRRVPPSDSFLEEPVAPPSEVSPSLAGEQSDVELGGPGADATAGPPESELEFEFGDEAGEESLFESTPPAAPAVDQRPVQGAISGPKPAAPPDLDPRTFERAPAAPDAVTETGGLELPSFGPDEVEGAEFEQGVAGQSASEAVAEESQVILGEPSVEEVGPAAVPEFASEPTPAPQSVAEEPPVTLSEPALEVEPASVPEPAVEPTSGPKTLAEEPPATVGEPPAEIEPTTEPEPTPEAIEEEPPVPAEEPPVKVEKKSASRRFFGGVDALVESVLGRRRGAGAEAEEPQAPEPTPEISEPMVAEESLPEPAEAEPAVSKLAEPVPASPEPVVSQPPEPEPAAAEPVEFFEAELEPREAAAYSEPEPELEPEPEPEPPPPPVFEQAEPAAAGPFVDEPSDRVPVTIGKGDPFAIEEPEAPQRVAGYVLAPSGPSDGIVRAGDNQLHLRLQGTGAIAESGQVRALDIEVPVPGTWVGHRRVTLQLRLTLTPAAEDEDVGPGGTS